MINNSFCYSFNDTQKQNKITSIRKKKDALFEKKVV